MSNGLGGEVVLMKGLEIVLEVVSDIFSGYLAIPCSLPD